MQRLQDLEAQTKAERAKAERGKSAGAGAKQP
jgi:hypothetical protein